MIPLSDYIQKIKREKGIGLMSHLVLGYPSLAENRQVIDAMVAGGVDLMELQLPFSEPCADGPVIAQANQAALDGGFRLEQGLALIEEVTAAHPIPFFIMTYFNVLFVHGVERFIERAAAIGVRGLIIPDLPLQEAAQAMALCRKMGLAWIQLMAPTCTDDRLAQIGQAGDGFVYCVARRGVTGKKTRFNQDVEVFLGRCRQASPVPLAVGFGVKAAADVAYLSTMAEIAVVGTAAIDIHQREGVAAVQRFFAGLRA